MAEASKRKQPVWAVPAGKPTGKLHLYNSLTRSKVEFVPNVGKRVKFYICGPTVYDHAHMGHARAYLSFDILRRVMTDYFGYDVQFVMNITDIDDKIIMRARQHHLLKGYLESHGHGINVQVVLEDVMEAVKCFRGKYEAETDPDKKKMFESMMGRVNAAALKLEESIKAKDATGMETAKASMLNEARDVLSYWLDTKKGSTVNEHHVFDALAKQYEGEFMADMQRLNVLPTDVLTRVSEYVPEIIEYVQRIIKNGYAYQADDGSVYFDTEKFASNPKHFYAKLVPEAYGDNENLMKNMREGEGELSMGADQLKMKHSASDFALWKASKEGEPFWDSPWGKGRPGWHIECSVMSNAVCGDQLDIHTGGLDLKFPHHDNEIAQVEAHFDHPHWVNYFLHCGTLRIEGLKMSKSLKNFITIRDALKKYTPRQLRILFLLHIWTDVLDYSAQSMERSLHFERVTNEFFLLVKDLLRRHWRPDLSQGYQKYNQRELDLLEEFFRIKAEIHDALCDSVDTRTAMEKLRKLVDLGNAYIIDLEKVGTTPNALLLRQITGYMTDMLKTFGVIPKGSDIGYPTESSDGAGTSASTEDVVMPYLDALAKFREEVRNIAKDHKVVEILKLCDKLRDDVLPELGVRLEDRANQTTIKLVDRETLLREQEQKRQAELAKQEEKERKAREKAEKEAARRIPPEELFKRGEEAAKYSKWDEKGIPTHTSDGEEISKKQRKKLEKLWETQQKNYQAAIAENGTNGTA